MKSNKQEKQFLEVIHILFQESEGDIVRNSQVFDKFLSNIYSRYYQIFHPSKYISLSRLIKILGPIDEINTEEIKINKAELANQANKILALKDKSGGYSSVGFDEKFARLVKIFGRPIDGSKIDWAEFNKYQMFFTDIDIIRRFKDNLNWVKLVEEPTLPWSIEFVGEFEKYLFINSKSEGNKLRSVFSHIEVVPWSEELLDKYIDCWDWDALSRNQGINFNERMILKYSDRWNWKALSANPSIFMTEKLLIAFLLKGANWEALGSNPNIQWTDNLIQKVEWKSFWKGLSSNPSFKWGIKILKKYEENWDWEHLSKSELIPWNEEILGTFEDRWYWKELCRNNSINWNRSLISKFIEKIDWYYLSLNENLLLSESDIALFQDKWRWDALCENATIKIDGNFLMKFKHYIRFNGIRKSHGGVNYYYEVPTFLRNPKLKLGKEEIKKLSEENNWRKGYVRIPYSEWEDLPGEWVELSKAKFLTTEILFEFSSFLDWNTLSENEFLPWDLDLVLQFKNLWNWEKLMDNETFWLRIIEPNLKLLNLKYINDMFKFVFLRDYLD